MQNLPRTDASARHDRVGHVSGVPLKNRQLAVAWFLKPITFSGTVIVNPHGSVEFEYPEEKLSPALEAVVAERVAQQGFFLITTALTRVFAEILAHNDPALTTAAIAYAGGMPILGGLSEVQLAARFKVTKQAFSRRVTEVSKQLSIAPSRGMRSEIARETFEEKQLCKPKTSLQLAIQSLRSGNSTRN